MVFLFWPFLWFDFVFAWWLVTLNTFSHACWPLFLNLFTCLPTHSLASNTPGNGKRGEEKMESRDGWGAISLLSGWHHVLWTGFLLRLNYSDASCFCSPQNLSGPTISDTWLARSLCFSSSSPRKEKSGGRGGRRWTYERFSWVRQGHDIHISPHIPLLRI